MYQDDRKHLTLISVAIILISMLIMPCKVIALQYLSHQDYNNTHIVEPGDFVQSKYDHPTLTSPTNLTFLPYENRAYKLIIQYPANWTKEEFHNQSSDVIVQFLPPLKSSAAFSINVSRSASTPLNVLIAGDIVNLRRNLANFHLIYSFSDIPLACPNLVPIHHCQAYEIAYSYGDKSGSSTVMQISTVFGDKYKYTVEYKAKSDKYYNTYLQTVLYMIGTLTIQQTPEFQISNISSALRIGSDPYYVTTDPLAAKLYLTNARSNTISVINSSADKVIANVTVGRIPTAIDINPITNTIYVANYGSNNVSVIDGSSDRVIDTIQVGYAPDAIAVDTEEASGFKSLVFVANHDSNNVSVIDGLTNKVIRSIPVGLGPGDIAIDPVINRIYVANSDSNNISVIDYFSTEGVGFKWQPITNITVGRQPSVLSLNPSTSSLYVANTESDTISVINTNTNRVIYNIPVDSAPYGIDVDPSTNTIYVANYGSSSVSVIDGSNNLQIAKIPVGSRPYDVHIDQHSRILYVTDLGSNTISELDINSKKLLEGVTFRIHPANAGFIQCDGMKFLNNDYVKYDLGTLCEAKASPGFVFDSWSSIQGAALGSNSSNGQDAITTNNDATFRFASYETVTAKFRPDVNPLQAFVQANANTISIIALILLIGVTVLFSIPSIIEKLPGLRKLKLPPLKKFDDATILEVDGAVIAGALILLTLTSTVGIITSQRTFITADIVFPFAISGIVALIGIKEGSRFQLFEVRLMIAGFVNLMISILLLAIISFNL